MTGTTDELRSEAIHSMTAAKNAFTEYDAVRRNVPLEEDRASLLRLADAARRAGEALQEVARATQAFMDATARDEARAAAEAKHPRPAKGGKPGAR